MAANDKAREDRAIARDYRKKKVERRKSWLRSVIKLQKEQSFTEPKAASLNSIEDKNQEETLSPLKPQQLYFGSTSGSSQVVTPQHPVPHSHSPPPSLSTPTISQSFIPLPLPLPVPQIVMANIPGAPRIHYIVHIPYFLGRPESDPDTHVAKFEITCEANDVPAANFQEVFAASLQEYVFPWYQRQPAFAD